MTVSETLTVIGAPTEGVITTVAGNVPAFKPVTSTLKVSSVLCPAASLSVVGVTVNHVEVGAPIVHFKVPPPPFRTLIVCAVGVGFVPAVVVNARVVALSSIWGGGIVKVMGRVTGLPATGFAVRESIALITTLVEIFVPPVKLVVSTLTLIEVVAPPAKFVPEAAESVNGVPVLSAAVQFNGDPPLFVITTG